MKDPLNNQLHLRRSESASWKRRTSWSSRWNTWGDFNTHTAVSLDLFHSFFYWMCSLVVWAQCFFSWWARVVSCRRSCVLGLSWARVPQLPHQRAPAPAHGWQAARRCGALGAGGAALPQTVALPEEVEGAGGGGGGAQHHGQRPGRSWRTEPERRGCAEPSWWGGTNGSTWRACTPHCAHGYLCAEWRRAPVMWHQTGAKLRSQKVQWSWAACVEALVETNKLFYITVWWMFIIIALYSFEQVLLNKSVKRAIVFLLWPCGLQ